MAERYLDNPLVIGADLRNEVRYIEGNPFIGKRVFKKGTFYYARVVSEIYNQYHLFAYFLWIEFYVKLTQKSRSEGSLIEQETIENVS